LKAGMSTGPKTQSAPPVAEAVPTWLSWAASSALGTAVASFLVLLLVRPAPPPEPAPNPTPWLATPEEIAQFAPDAGVADEAQSSVQDVPKAVMPLVLTIGAPMPKKPMEGQKKPPCGPGQIAVNDACWAGPIKGQAAPCRQGMYDYEGECYFAIYDAPRQPTSEQP